MFLIGQPLIYLYLIFCKYINNILTLTFSGEVTFDIQQQKDEFEDFNKFAKEN